MTKYRATFYRVPESPLARFGLALLGLALLVVSFAVGLVFLAVVAGLAIVGSVALTIRNWWWAGGVGGVGRMKTWSKSNTGSSIASATTERLCRPQVIASSTTSASSTAIQIAVWPIGLRLEK